MEAEADAMTSYEEWQKEYEAELMRTKRVFAEQREQIRRDYAGQYVGFACGRVIAADMDVDSHCGHGNPQCAARVGGYFSGRGGAGV